MSQLSFFGLATRVWTVGDVTRYVRQLLDGDYRLQDVWIGGEVSNLSRPASGHLYFTLKDGEASLRCVMWRTDVVRQRFSPREGDAVEAHGRISVYEAAGQHQLYADVIRLSGEGAAYQDFLRLKARLEAEGLFDRERKRPLPGWPGRIGVVTSPSGAAWRDVVHILRRRFPLAEVILAPTPVQGGEAPGGIVAALDALNRHGAADVILLVRGGGSIEDLAAFNDESVVRAVAASKTPVVSGVGHETDFTLTDLAADHRAPTPSAAAEIITPDREDLRLAVRQMMSTLAGILGRRLTEARAELWARERALRSASPRSQVANARQRVDDLAHRALSAVRGGLSLRSTELRGLIQTLRAVGPEAVLARGFAVVQQAAGGGIVRSTHQVRAGDRLSVRVQDGSFPAVAGDGGE